MKARTIHILVVLWIALCANSSTAMPDWSEPMPLTELNTPFEEATGGPFF